MKAADEEVPVASSSAMPASSATPATDTPGGDARGQDGFVRNDADKDSRARFSLISAFSCAGSGLLYALRSQRNMKIHVGIAVLAIVLGLFLSIDVVSWAVIAVCIALVFAAECLNTAVESVVDLVSPRYHELARRAKDCAAAAVLVCALGAVVVAAVIFVPRIVALIAG